jgi:hypothetical protein
MEVQNPMYGAKTVVAFTSCEECFFATIDSMGKSPQLLYLPVLEFFQGRSTGAEVKFNKTLQFDAGLQ